MLKAVVFQGLNTLNFEGIRTSVVRIPEVIRRVKEAQRICDSQEVIHLDLFNFLTSEDQVFLSNLCLKSLLSAIVQVGLFDRYLRYNQPPQVLAGHSNGDSALKVAAGVLTFEEMIFQSAALQLSRSLAPLHLTDSPIILSGISLTEYGAYSVDPEKTPLAEVAVDKADPAKFVATLVEKLGVRCFVNIGPGNLLYFQLEEDLRMADIQVLESIDLDPMLSWFWPSLSHRNLAMIQ